jgi:hypothetical protein
VTAVVKVRPHRCSALSRRTLRKFSTIAQLTIAMPRHRTQRIEFVKVIFRIQINRYTAHKEYRFK